MSQDSTRTVDLTLSGRQSQVDSIRKEDVRVNVDLENMGQGRHQVKLSGKNVSLPSGVTVERIMPTKIEVTLNRRQRTEDRGQKIDDRK